MVNSTEYSPVSNVVFFDGVCAMCNRFVVWLLEQDRKNTLHFAPIQGATYSALRRRVVGLPEDVSTIVFAQMYILHHDTKSPTKYHAAAGIPVADDGADYVSTESPSAIFLRSTAVLKIMQTLGGFWAVVGLLGLLIPLPVRDYVYTLVARHRYRVFGTAEFCVMLSPEERARILP